MFPLQRRSMNPLPKYGRSSRAFPHEWNTREEPPRSAGGFSTARCYDIHAQPLQAGIDLLLSLLLRASIDLRHHEGFRPVAALAQRDSQESRPASYPPPLPFELSAYHSVGTPFGNAQSPRIACAG